MKRLLYFIILLSLLLSFASCGPPGIEPSEIIGQVILDGYSGSIQPYVLLYEYTNYLPSSEIGASFNSDLLFDHRLNIPVDSTVCDSAGNFSFQINRQLYIIAAFAQGYGWSYSEPFASEDTLDIGTIALFPEIQLPVNITQDLTLDSNHHYIVENTVQLEQGRTLRIQPGAWITFSNSSSQLVILGAVISQGTEDNWIHFTSSDYESPPCMWSRIALNNDNDETSSFNFTVFSFASSALSVNNLKASIDNCVFMNCNTALSITSSDYTELTHSSILNCQRGVDCVTNIRINEVLIDNCAQTGVQLSNYNAEISNSLISNCQTALRESYADIFQIQRCSILYNQIGLEFAGGLPQGLSVFSSDIKYNELYGLFCHTDGYPTVEYCNFDNEGFNIYLQGQSSGSQYLQSGDITAENNYWNHTQAAVIRQKIYDRNYPGANNDLGEVDFIPFSNTEIVSAGPQ